MKAPTLGRWLDWQPEKPLAKTDETASSVSFGKSLSGVERQILDVLRHGPATSAALFEALADGQQTTPEVQRRIDDALDAYDARDALAAGCWHYREIDS